MNNYEKSKALLEEISQNLKDIRIELEKIGFIIDGLSEQLSEMESQNEYRQD